MTIKNTSHHDIICYLTLFGGYRLFTDNRRQTKSDYIYILSFYTTKGRDRFHWAATPLKPYKVGNICYMTYRYSVLYFLNLSLKHFFCHRKRQFLWKYPNPETVIVPCFNAFAHAQLMNIYFQFFAGDNIYINKFYRRNTFTTKLRGRPFDSAGEGGGLAVYVESEYLFPIFCGRQYLFSSNFSTDHLF